MNRIRQATVFTRVHLMLCIGIARAARVVTKDESQPHYGKRLYPSWFIFNFSFFIVWRQKQFRVFGKVKATNDQPKRLSTANSKLHTVWEMMWDMAVTATSEVCEDIGHLLYVGRVFGIKMKRYCMHNWQSTYVYIIYTYLSYLI